jgi:thiamine-phosphate pyrophosphorylase
MFQRFSDVKNSLKSLYLAGFMQEKAKAKIYLISPEKIQVSDFLPRLKRTLATGLVPAFQLRLKGYEAQEIAAISCEVKKICTDFNCLFLLNDFLEVAMDVGASGVHLGVDDVSIAHARKKSPQNFVIGASCYDSRDLAMQAGGQGADYLSFGAFFPTKTKVSRGKPTPEILKWCNELITLPTVAIGGINDKNCAELVQAGVDFLSVISYVWNQVGEEDLAVKKLQEAIQRA